MATDERIIDSTALQRRRCSRRCSSIDNLDRFNAAFFYTVIMRREYMRGVAGVGEQDMQM